MKSSIRIQARSVETGRRRRKKKEPDPQTLLRVEWIEWLIETYGADDVADWQDPPVTFAEWKRNRELSAHEAA
jgi:hypothetical protein